MTYLPTHKFIANNEQIVADNEQTFYAFLIRSKFIANKEQTSANNQQIDLFIICYEFVKFICSLFVNYLL